MFWNNENIITVSDGIDGIIFSATFEEKLVTETGDSGCVCVHSMFCHFHIESNLFLRQLMQCYQLALMRLDINI